MKRKYNILFALILGGMLPLLSSCFKDKGNYTYGEINQVGISFDQEAYEVLRYYELGITPSLSYTLGEKEDGYEYLWILETGSSRKQNDTISREKVLKKSISVKTGTYNLYLSVKDLNTKVSYRKDVQLNVKTELSQGYLLLCSQGDKMTLDMLARESLIKDDAANFKLLKNLGSQLPRMEKPKAIRYRVITEAEDPDDWFSDNLYFHSMAVMAENQMITLDEKLDYFEHIDVHKNTTIPFEQPFRPENSFEAGGKEFLFANGNFYFRGTMMMEQFNAPGNAAAEPYRVYPDMMAFGGGDQLKQALFYDETNSRFVYIKSGDYCSPVVPEAGKDDYYNIGRKMLYMRGPCYNNNGYAVTQGPGEKDFDLYVYVGAKAADVRPVIYLLSSLPGISEAKFFDISTTQPYLFYATDTKVYQISYDLGVATLQEVYIAESGKKIAAVKFNRFTADNTYIEGVDRLLVCVNDTGAPEEQCGELYIYTLQGNNGKPVKFASYTGIGKIVDVAYKEQ